MGERVLSVARLDIRRKSQLDEACYMLTEITPQFRLAPGVLMNDVPLHDMAWANATYALQYLDPRTCEVAGVMGFEVRKIKNRLVMKIPHVFQGSVSKKKDPEAGISSSARRRLISQCMNHGLPQRAMGALIDFARSIGVEEIVGISATNHCKAEDIKCSHKKSPEEVIDKQFIEAGFVTEQDRNFHLYL